MIASSPPRRRTALITGGTGFIGRHLCQRLKAQGWDVIVWRHRQGLPPALQTVRRVDAVVNLAGARILGKPWTKSRRRVLLESRLGPTAALVRWLAQCEERPEVLVSASAVGFYGVRGEEPVDEAAGPQQIFQSDLCRRWEDAVSEVSGLGLRWVTLRFGVVLGTDGGALPALVRPARMGLAAVMGHGRQGFPWIHIEDAVGLIQWAIDQREVQGPVNAVAPETVSQRQFQQVLSEVLGRRLLLRVPAWPMRIAMGEMAQLLLDGQYVVPARALEGGFRFSFPGLRGALENLLTRGQM